MKTNCRCSEPNVINAGTSCRTCGGAVPDDESDEDFAKRQEAYEAEFGDSAPFVDACLKAPSAPNKFWCSAAADASKLMAALHKAGVAVQFNGRKRKEFFAQTSYAEGQRVADSLGVAFCPGSMFTSAQLDMGDA